MAWLPCPYLGADVELTDERVRHIESKHPDLWPRYAERVNVVLADPAAVATRGDPHELGFVRWFPDVLDGAYVAVVVRSHGRDDGTLRYWVTTAYLTTREITWQRFWQAQ